MKKLFLLLRLNQLPGRQSILEELHCVRLFLFLDGQGGRSGTGRFLLFQFVLQACPGIRLRARLILTELLKSDFSAAEVNLTVFQGFVKNVFVSPEKTLNSLKIPGRFPDVRKERRLQAADEVLALAQICRFLLLFHFLQGSRFLLKVLTLRFTPPDLVCPAS